MLWLHVRDEDPDLLGLPAARRSGAARRERQPGLLDHLLGPGRHCLVPRLAAEADAHGGLLPQLPDHVLGLPLQARDQVQDLPGVLAREVLAAAPKLVGAVLQHAANLLRGDPLPAGEAPGLVVVRGLQEDPPELLEVLRLRGLQLFHGLEAAEYTVARLDDDLVPYLLQGDPVEVVARGVEHYPVKLGRQLRRRHAFAVVESPERFCKLRRRVRVAYTS
mmetsp:Transcript_21272/g.43051  ORF Transcript_21272/g.43051 Transcript_21272/m.43051 type:complete len:220 (-) Transcript_21272:275-934(-)